MRSKYLSLLYYFPITEKKGFMSFRRHEPISVRVKIKRKQLRRGFELRSLSTFLGYDGKAMHLSLALSLSLSPSLSLCIYIYPGSTIYLHAHTHTHTHTHMYIVELRLSNRRVISSKIMFENRFVRKLKQCCSSRLGQPFGHIRFTSASCSAVFGLPQQSFVPILYSSARLVCSNSDYLFDHRGIFYKNILVEL